MAHGQRDEERVRPFPERLRIINGLVKPRYALLREQTSAQAELSGRTLERGRSDTLVAMTVAVHLVEHPLIADSLTRVRDKDTPERTVPPGARADRHAADRRGNPWPPHPRGRVHTPLVTPTGRALSSQPVVVPVLRAGLGFVHAAQELLPNADVGFIGVSRDEETFQPKPYVNKLPESLAGRQCIVLDPMLATGGSLAHTCQLLLERGATGTIIVVLRAGRARGHRAC